MKNMTMTLATTARTKTTVSSQKLEAIKSLICSAKKKMAETYPISRTDAADYSLDFLNALDREFSSLMEDANALQTEVANGSIYMLPCTFTGLDAEIDNCDPPATVVHVEHESMPMSDGCVERYRTADGYLVDCSIDFVDFADWFGQELKEES